MPAVYVIGQTGYRALLHKDPRLVEEFHYGATAPTLQRARDITVDAIDDFKSGKLDEIYLIYTKIQNALTSEPVMERLLPLDREHLKPAPKGLGDPRGEVEMFPDAKTVFEQTAPIYMHGMIFGAMTESFCAEQSARMTAMDSATKSANDMIHELSARIQPHSSGLPSPRRSPRSSAALRRSEVTNNRKPLRPCCTATSAEARQIDTRSFSGIWPRSELKGYTIVAECQGLVA